MNRFTFYDVGEYRIFYEWRGWQRQIPDGLDQEGNTKMRPIGDYVSVLVMRNGECVRAEWI